VRERLNLELERLIILTLDLKLGLQFFDKKLEPGDLRAELLKVGCAWRWPRGGRDRRLKVLRGRRSAYRSRSDEGFR
jgi:hypothetical protein